LKNKTTDPTSLRQRNNGCNLVKFSHSSCSILSDHHIYSLRFM